MVSVINDITETPWPRYLQFRGHFLLTSKLWRPMIQYRGGHTAGPHTMARWPDITSVPGARVGRELFGIYLPIYLPIHFCWGELLFNIPLRTPALLQLFLSQACKWFYHAKIGKMQLLRKESKISEHNWPNPSAFTWCGFTYLHFCLFKVIVYGFYHGKGNMFNLFTTTSSKS